VRAPAATPCICASTVPPLSLAWHLLFTHSRQLPGSTLPGARTMSWVRAEHISYGFALSTFAPSTLGTDGSAGTRDALEVADGLNAHQVSPCVCCRGRARWGGPTTVGAGRWLLAEARVKRSAPLWLRDPILEHAGAPDVHTPCPWE
jgi:hypothetical protein